MRNLRRFVVAATLLAACGNPPTNPDAADARTDTNRTDARDGGGNDVIDVITPEAGREAGVEAGMDAGMEAGTEAGTEAGMEAGMDAGMDASDAGLTPSQQIAAVRMATPGAVSLTVSGVLVTYVVGGTSLADGGVSANDPPGFFVQAERTGPALFVAVDPATLTPRPAVGDMVSFRVTMTSTMRTGAVWATAISDYARASMGNPVAPLIQDLSSAADIVTGLTGYESELIHLAGTVATDFGAAGTGFESAQITTAGVTTAMTGLRLRVPAMLRATLGLRNGCQFTIDATPLWRFNAQAQPSAWVAGDIMVGTCPPPMDGGTDAGVDAAVDVVLPDAPPSDASTPHLVINEIQTRSATAATQEYVEIYNPGPAAVSLAGWRIYYASAGSSTMPTTASWTGEAGLMIAAGGYVLIGNMAYRTSDAGGLVAPTSSVDLSSGMADSGQVGLFDPAGMRVDSVAFGTITATTPPFQEGSAPAPIASGTGVPYIVARHPNGVDTDQNSVDFQGTNTPTPLAANP